MNKDDIIRMAREAGLLRTGNGWTMPERWGADELERFAALVAAHEREACAKVCEDERNLWQRNDIRDTAAALGMIAKAIRARGEA